MKNNKMFCFQCEQIDACSGDTDVCGKLSSVENLQDALTGALIGLARACQGDTKPGPSTWELMIEGLFTTVANVNFYEETVKDLIKRVHAEKEGLVPRCLSCKKQCGRNDDYDMRLLRKEKEDIRSLKSLILFGIRGIASYVCKAMVLGCREPKLNRFIADALFAVGEDLQAEALLSLVLEVGGYNLTCMELLERANTETFGRQTSVKMTMTVEKEPFIVVTEHNLLELKLLLEQTKDKGIHIYTHREMLPAHAYLQLKKYPHWKGDFGTVHY